MAPFQSLPANSVDGARELLTRELENIAALRWIGLRLQESNAGLRDTVGEWLRSRQVGDQALALLRRGEGQWRMRRVFGQMGLGRTSTSTERWPKPGSPCRGKTEGL